MKRVGLYYPWIYVRSGVERLILEVVRRSRHRYTVFTNHLNREQTYPEFRDLPNLVELRCIPVERSFRAVTRAAATIALQKLDLEGFDALLVSSEGLGDLITFRNHSKPVICFCHTPVRPVYDPVYRRLWLQAHPRARLPLALFSLAYGFVTRRAWRHYRRVFVNSREVASRIARGRLCPPDRLEVLHPGVALERVRPGFRHEGYFLYAGRIKWTKNVELALEAFREFKRAYRGACPWRLVVAGSVDDGSRIYLESLAALAAPEPSVTFRINPSDDELQALYDGCYALLYPSLNEDWGMVPLEAMAHGKPVLAVNGGGPRESVVDGETGFLLEPAPQAFAERMAWLAERPEQVRDMGRAAVERVRRYSWDGFVRRLDDCVDGIC